ncbi:hypothetical protein NX059_009532 [Plenodomus lindquistii]|nr:hypothetical protein NX059_009532 [Plenodomus lindquistii]
MALSKAQKAARARVAAARARRAALSPSPSPSQAFIALKATGASKDELRRPRRELRLLLKVLKEEEDELPAFGAAPAAGERAGLPSRRENVKRLIGELVDEVMR